MNIILIPNSHGKRHVSLPHRHVLLLLLVGLVALPILLGTVSYRIHGLLTGPAGPALLATQQAELKAQRARLSQTRAHTEAHLNALAQRLGQLQAQVLRLNALGSRLARMAKLDQTEFDFQATPGLGGPETDAAHASPDVLGALDQLTAQIDRQQARLRALESLLLDRHLAESVTPSGWPAQGGWMSSGFGLRADPFSGRRSYHEGVDIASKLGSPVKAMGDGVISFAGIRSGYGRLVEITHGNRLLTRYAHTRTVLVKVGDRVAKGQPIALIGSSGRSTGPHLHFEVVRNGRAVNPQGYLKMSRRDG